MFDFIFRRNFCPLSRTRTPGHPEPGTRNAEKISYNLLLFVYDEPPRTPSSSAAPIGEVDENVAFARELTLFHDDDQDSVRAVQALDLDTVRTVHVTKTLTSR